MNDPVNKLLAGLISLFIGIIMFYFMANETRKKGGDPNFYDFNVYLAAIVIGLLGLFLVCSAIASFLA